MKCCPSSAWHPERCLSIPTYNTGVQALCRWEAQGSVRKSLLQPPRFLIKQIASLAKTITLTLYSGRYKEYVSTASSYRAAFACIPSLLLKVDSPAVLSALCATAKARVLFHLPAPGHSSRAPPVTWAQSAEFCTHCMSESCWHHTTIQEPFPTLGSETARSGWHTSKVNASVCYNGARNQT